MDFDLTDYNHSNYWEPQGSAETDTGKWSYSNGKLNTNIDGYSMSFPVTLKNGELTMTGTYEDSTETWTSVYKKTKYEENENEGESSTVAYRSVNILNRWYTF